MCVYLTKECGAKGVLSVRRSYYLLQDHEASFAVLARNILGRDFSDHGIVKLVPLATFFFTNGPIVAVVRSATCQIKYEPYSPALDDLL